MNITNLINSKINKRSRRKKLITNCSNGLKLFKNNILVQGLHLTTVNFCQNSNLHGVKYIFEKGNQRANQMKR